MSESRARERSGALREVPFEERQRLRRGFGAVLRAEREPMTQAELARRSGLSVRTIERLEAGERRPTSKSVWLIVLALRPREETGIRARVALDQRLREAAGESFRDHSRRPHARRERTRAEMLAEAQGQPLVARGDVLGRVAMTALARGRAREA